MGNQDTVTRSGAAQHVVARVGASVVIKGEVIGSEDLIIDGAVEGRIELPEHVLTVGRYGRYSRGHRRQDRHRARYGSRLHDGAPAGAGLRHRVGRGRYPLPRVAISDGAVIRGRIDTLTATKATSDPDLAVVS